MSSVPSPAAQTRENTEAPHGRAGRERTPGGAAAARAADLETRP